MSKNLEIKKQIVEDVAKDLSENESTVVFDYTGIEANEMNALRGQLHENGTKLKIIKNTLIKRVLEKIGTKLDKDLEGQNAILITQSDDLVSPIKTLFEFVKEREKGEVKIGVLNGSVISAEKVKELSNLPSREELLGQVVGGMQSPIRGFAYTLNGVQSQFVRALGAVRDSKDN